MADATEWLPRLQKLREALDRVVIGQAQVKESMLVCLLAGGHGLIEGVPGTAKTLLVLALGRLLNCTFKRVQFTPDLMPVDLLGTNVFNPKTQEFAFHPGPIFTDFLLADEFGHIDLAQMERLRGSWVAIPSFGLKALRADSFFHTFYGLYFPLCLEDAAPVLTIAAPTHWIPLSHGHHQGGSWIAVSLSSRARTSTG